MTQPALRLLGMRKELRSTAHEFALEVPELTIEKGQFVGLVGKSGSGKSTLLDILAMVSAPTAVAGYSLGTDAGEIDLSDLIARRDDVAIAGVRLRHFGYVLQAGGLFEFLTVRQNLELPFRLAGRPIDTDEIEAQCAPFEISDQLEKRPSALSGGQRQRVAILRALSMSPAVVLADEPTASVDETMSQAIVRLLRDLAKSRGATVVMVSHDVDLIEAHADSMFMLKPEAVSERLTVSRLQIGSIA